jgi:hypothetical protein
VVQTGYNNASVGDYMASVYTKDFLVDAFCFRYDEAGLNTREMREMALAYYDTVTKDQFRASCCLDSQELARYKKYCLENCIVY